MLNWTHLFHVTLSRLFVINSIILNNIKITFPSKSFLSIHGHFALIKVKTQSSLPLCWTLLLKNCFLRKYLSKPWGNPSKNKNDWKGSQISYTARLWDYKIYGLSIIIIIIIIITIVIAIIIIIIMNLFRHIHFTRNWHFFRKAKTISIYC